jgi:hypothetical protein
MTSKGEYNFDFHNNMCIIVAALLAVSIIVVTPVININSAFASSQQQHGLNNNDSRYRQCLKLLDEVRNQEISLLMPIPEYQTLANKCKDGSHQTVNNVIALLEMADTKF